MRNRTSEDWEVKALLDFVLPGSPGVPPDHERASLVVFLGRDQAEKKDAAVRAKERARLPVKLQRAMWKDFREFVGSLDEPLPSFETPKRMITSPDGELLEPLELIRFRRQVEKRASTLAEKLNDIYARHAELWGTYFGDPNEVGATMRTPLREADPQESLEGRRTLQPPSAQALVLLRGADKLLRAYLGGEAYVSGTCQNCGKYLIQNGKHRHKKFCDNKCRSKADYALRKARPETV